MTFQHARGTEIENRVFRFTRLNNRAVRCKSELRPIKLCDSRTSSHNNSLTSPL